MEPDLKQAGFAVCLRYFSIYHRFICISLHSIFFNHNILDNKNCTGLVIRIIYPDFQTWKYLPFFASYFPKAAETLDFLASSRFPYLPSNSAEFGNPEHTRNHTSSPAANCPSSFPNCNIGLVHGFLSPPLSWHLLFGGFQSSDRAIACTWKIENRSKPGLETAQSL